MVIGSGPNGLAAAIVLAQAGFAVEVREASSIPGGGASSGELTLPGFMHDLGSAAHPMGVSSYFFASLGLENFGLKWIHSPSPLAHPFQDGTAVTLERDVMETASQLGHDGPAYERLYRRLSEHWPQVFRDVFQPQPRIPQHPFLMAHFGLRALQPCSMLLNGAFRGGRAKALVAGSAAHSALRLEEPVSAAFGLVMGAAGHAVGWPIAEGGSQQISNALVRVLESLGGRVATNCRVGSLSEISGAELTMCDVTPRQFLRLAEGRLRKPFRQLLERFEYGPGIFKMDWALSQPIPWTARECFRAATVHVAGSYEEIATSERAAAEGRPPEKPFILLVQPTLFDTTRAPAGRHIAWAYCHVPQAWRGSAVQQIEDQIERFAPGFRDCILAKAAHGTQDMERWDANLVGGDVNGGALNAKQFVLRPTWRQYGTPLKGVYLCSASTPPGGAVHGMCGYWAAQRALKDRRLS